MNQSGVQAVQVTESYLDWTQFLKVEITMYWISTSECKYRCSHSLTINKDHQNGEELTQKVYSTCIQRIIP